VQLTKNKKQLALAHEKPVYLYPSSLSSALPPPPPAQKKKKREECGEKSKFSAHGSPTGVQLPELYVE
jgi:hypothetical protein